MRKVEGVDWPATVLEVIACSVADALEAQLGGAGRLEIISALERGGLTPSLELVRNILRAVSLPVRVMLRENDGYEVTGEAELERLCGVARELSALRVDGVVLGFLHGAEIDLDLTKRVLSCAPNLKATFHHAFEDARDPIEAIRKIKTLKQVDRILTSGGAGVWTDKLERLARYRQEARPEIEIIAGGGINPQTIKSICAETDIREFHVGRAARVPANANGVVQAAPVRALVELIEKSTLDTTR
jgi:copper homeostasis protein